MSQFTLPRAIAAVPARYVRTAILIVALVLVASMTFTPQAVSNACGGMGQCQCPGC